MLNELVGPNQGSWLTIVIAEAQNNCMNPYEVERMAAFRMDDYMREVEQAVEADRAGRSTGFAAAVAETLRRVADWIDGRSAARRANETACALD
jgi:hypothetical protein